MELIPPVTLYGDLPVVAGDPAFGEPVWKNGDDTCFLWRTDTTPPQPFAIRCQPPIRKLGTGPAPPASFAAVPPFADSTIPTSAELEARFVDAPVEVAAATLSPGATVELAYVEPSTGDTLSVPATIGLYDAPTNAVALTLHRTADGIVDGEIVALARKKVQKVLAGMPAPSTSPPKGKPKSNPLGSAGNLMGGPTVWAGLALIGILVLSRKRGA